MAGPRCCHLVAVRHIVSIYLQWDRISYGTTCRSEGPLIDTAAEPRPHRPERQLVAVVGSHPFLGRLREQEPLVEGLRLSFDDSFVPTHTAFHAMAEHQRFALSELALATYVQARAAGKPLTLLPVTLTSRFQHDQLVADMGPRKLRPVDLAGARVGVRSYSQTTGVWLRAILQRQYGVDLERVEWVVFEEPHVRGAVPPANVTLREDGDMHALFLDGKLDAVIGSGLCSETIRPVIPSPKQAARLWYELTGCVTLNHVLTVREDVLEQDPEGMRAVYRRFREAVSTRAEVSSTAEPGQGWQSAVEMLPVGYDAILPALRTIADEAHRQGLIAGPLADADLAHPIVRDWN